MRKKSFITIGAVLTCLLLLPNVSVSEVIIHDSDNRYSRLYISGQYKPGISHFSGFSVKEANVATAQLVGLGYTVSTNIINSNSSFSIPYKVTFQDSIISFSAAMGYFDSNGPRVELEGSYKKFDVTDPEIYKERDAHRYFAVAREITDPGGSPKNKKFTVMRNGGISIASVIFNGCYDVPLNISGMSPYICVGIGGDFIEFFDVLHIKPACQGKLGISYSLSPKSSLFIGGYYHKVIGKQFNNLSVQHVVELDTRPSIASVVATLNVGYFGGEIGMRLIF
ncbi:MAG: P44/Msp2 family outer membrane protein [Ehrlichia sp.]